MMKRTLISALLLAAMLLSSLLGAGTALAEVTNRDMQLMGGVVVSNATDSFFFCPMEEGMTRHWGLYALSTASEGPIVEVQDGYPARLVHATDSKVYFMGYTDGARTVQSLYSVDLASKDAKELLSGISASFVGGKAEEFFYVSETDAYTLRRYNVVDEKDETIKDMSNSSKKIYDAGQYGEDIYFLTVTENGTEDGYQYHAGSGKATNLDKPSPQLVTGVLYEGYRIYAGDVNISQIYSIKIGSKNGNRLGQQYKMSLSNHRFGQYVYAYDGDNNQLVAMPLDGSDPLKLSIEGGTLKRMVLGGTSEELLLMANDRIYAVKPDLSSQQELFEFSANIGGQAWSHVAPGVNAVFVMGYGQESYTNADTVLPTGVYAIDRNSGEMLFSYPPWDPNAATEEFQQTERPETFGDIPEDERAEGETYFVFSSGEEEETPAAATEPPVDDDTPGEEGGLEEDDDSVG